MSWALQSDAEKLAQRKRIGRTPCNPTLRIEAFEVPNQQQPK
jgi:hypothetical protein